MVKITSILPIAAVALTQVHLLAEFRPPAKARPAVRGANGAAILPGGRVIQPLGEQFPTGPGPFSIAASPSGRSFVSVNLGPERASVTVLRRDGKEAWSLTNYFTAEKSQSEKDFRSVGGGVAMVNDKLAWISEGDSGRVRLIDLLTGERRKLVDLNQGALTASYSGALAFDAEKNLLYVVDQAHFRLVIVDAVKGVVVSEAPTGFLPYSISLAPDKKRVWVTNLGMFRYRVLPGADSKHAVATGLPFPAFGFPSPEASAGVTRKNGGGGDVAVPPLGDPNAMESNSVTVIDVSNPAQPKPVGTVRTGLPFGAESESGSSPSGVLATADAVYVSNAHEDSIDVIDPSTLTVEETIPLRIPGLERLRGVLPLGMAYDETRHWLLVAEAGINAIGVIDTRRHGVIGLLPAGWYPAGVVLQDGVVLVANVKGRGTGPSSTLVPPDFYEFGGVLRRGSISRFPLPAEKDLGPHTRLVLDANGFRPVADEPWPDVSIHHVVVIVKENRTFDEVFGDMKAANGPVAGVARYARFGDHGYAEGHKSRFSLQGVAVTPNHHALAARFSFSDNFYADSEVSVDGHHWIVGAYPDAWTESSLLAAYSGQKHFLLDDQAPGRLLFAESNSSVHPEEQEQAGSVWQHLERNHVSFLNFGEGFELAGDAEDPDEEPTGARLLTNVPMPDALYRNTSRVYPGFNMNIPDQFRAAQFIAEIKTRFVDTGKDLPQLLFLHLPNDHTADPRPEDGYPYAASYVADNDLALGKIVEFLSHTPWWRDMAIFVTEDDAQSGIDHVDAHRTVFLAAGPYCRKNYASHVNASFPSIWKTAFHFLQVPPLNLFDATAADLRDLFTTEPDFDPYTAVPSDPRLFDPATARAPLHPKPSIPMDGAQPLPSRDIPN
ncbi:bifunctional YncE family protein/alkaline phosphatase family protein [Nevskia soli]|uniref:bifunctional YncE family protein/alkaline phosphatase family protein n=1 Tax=Nevskia soli TaxID=418856 RepID=UPI0015D9621C|nr:alkaline phosphatase family protein [Nevskia soli]